MLCRAHDERHVLGLEREINYTRYDFESERVVSGDKSAIIILYLARHCRARPDEEEKVVRFFSIVFVEPSRKTFP